MARLSKGNVLGPEKPGGPARAAPDSPWAKANAAKLQKMGIPGKGVAKSPGLGNPKSDDLDHGSISRLLGEWKDLQQSKGIHLIKNLREWISNNKGTPYLVEKLSYLEKTSKDLDRKLSAISVSTSKAQFNNLRSAITTYRYNIYDLEPKFLRMSPHAFDSNTMYHPNVKVPKKYP